MKNIVNRRLLPRHHGGSGCCCWWSCWWWYIVRQHRAPRCAATNAPLLYSRTNNRAHGKSAVGNVELGAIFCLRLSWINCHLLSSITSSAVFKQYYRAVHEKKPLNDHCLLVKERISKVVPDFFWPKLFHFLGACVLYLSTSWRHRWKNPFIAMFELAEVRYIR